MYYDLQAKNSFNNGYQIVYVTRIKKNNNNMTKTKNAFLVTKYIFLHRFAVPKHYLCTFPHMWILH